MVGQRCPVRAGHGDRHRPMARQEVLGSRRVLLLRSGLVDQSVRVVPVTKITALSAFQSVTQRLVGVWGLNVQSPGDRNGSAVAIECLSGRRLDELRVALESGGPDHGTHQYETGPWSVDRSALPGLAAYFGDLCASRWPAGDCGVDHGRNADRRGDQQCDFAGPPRCAGGVVPVLRIFTRPRIRIDEEIVEPEGVIAVLITLAMVAILAGVVLGTLRLHRFTLIRDGDVLRNSRGLLGKQAATIPVVRVQAVRIVEGFWRMLLGYCSLQVEVAGIGRANISQRMLFPLVRIDRAEALIRRALPELPWPGESLLVLPARVHRRYLTLPLEYAAGFTLLMLFLPGWWELLAVLPLPLGYVLGVARAREARWRVDDQSVVLRWRRLLNRNTVIAHRGGSQLTELSSSPGKARAGVAGFKMRFSSGRGAGIRYMVDSDALFLLHTVGRASARKSAHAIANS